MTDIKTLAKEYLQADFVQEPPNGYGYNKIEALEELIKIRKWMNDAYSVLGYLRRQPQLLTDTEDSYVVEVLLNGVFADEPSLYGVLDGIEVRWSGGLDKETLEKLSYLSRFHRLYKPETEQEQTSINHLLELYYQGDEQAESTLEHFVQMERPLADLLREMGYRNLLKEVA